MHEQFMRLALAQAAQSGSDVPVGAVIVRDGQVIASAHNEREAQDSPLAHAEMLAMERACRPAYPAAEWLHAVCDAGALSHVRRGDGDGAAGRLRFRRIRCAAGLLRQRVRSAARSGFFPPRALRRRGAGE